VNSRKLLKTVKILLGKASCVIATEQNRIPLSFILKSAAYMKIIIIADSLALFLGNIILLCAAFYQAQNEIDLMKSCILSR
jgi:hypothetical protein